MLRKLTAKLRKHLPTSDGAEREITRKGAVPGRGPVPRTGPPPVFAPRGRRTTDLRGKRHTR